MKRFVGESRYTTPNKSVTRAIAFIKDRIFNGRSVFPSMLVITTLIIHEGISAVDSRAIERETGAKGGIELLRDLPRGARGPLFKIKPRISPTRR